MATLHEFGEALYSLDANPAFRRIRQQFDSDDVPQWTSSLELFRKLVGKKGRKAPITAIRDDIGGHFGESAAMKAIRSLAEGESEIEVLLNKRTGKSGCVLHFAKHLALSHSGGREYDAWFKDFYSQIVAAYKAAVACVEYLVYADLFDRFEGTETE